MKIGDKVKTKLQQPKIMCSGRTIVNFFHWWVVTNDNNSFFTLQDKNGNTMQVDKNGNGIGEDSDHKVYKIKSS